MKKVMLIPIEDDSMLILYDFMDFSDFTKEIASTKESERKLISDAERSIMLEEIAKWRVN